MSRLRNRCRIDWALHHCRGLWCCLLAALALCGCTAFKGLQRDLAAPPPRHERKEDTLAAFEAQRDAAQLQAAMNRWREGNVAACGELLSGLVERNPKLVDARLQFAEWHLHQESFSEAEQQVRAALILAPERADVHHCLARVLEASGQNDLARNHFHQAAQLEPANELYRLTDAEGPIVPASYTASAKAQPAG